MRSVSRLVSALLLIACLWTFFCLWVTFVPMLAR